MQLINCLPVSRSVSRSEQSGQLKQIKRQMSPGNKKCQPRWPKLPAAIIALSAVVFILFSLDIFTLSNFRSRPDKFFSGDGLADISSDSNIYQFSNTPENFLDVSRTYQAGSFWAVISSVQRQDYSNPPLSGLIIPHHLLAEKLIASGIRRLQAQQPKLIIIVGPNHFFSEETRILTTKKSWQTVVGPVYSQVDFIEKLLSDERWQQRIKLDDPTLIQDHTVYAPLPFISYYLPDAELVPLLLPRSLTLEELKIFATDLVVLIEKSNYQTDEVVMIGSIDFSHYLLPAEAEEKDEITLKIIQERDWESLLMLNDDYIDSPTALALTFEFAQKLGADEMEVFDHTNAGQILGRRDIECTSYFEIGIY